MKTTIDLPDSLFEKTKIAAAQRRTTFKKLVIDGLERLLADTTPKTVPLDALARLKSGYHLGGKPLSREDSHAG